MRFKIKIAQSDGYFKATSVCWVIVGYKIEYTKLRVGTLPWIYLIHSKGYFCASSFPSTVFWPALGYSGYLHLLHQGLWLLPPCRTASCQLPSMEGVQRCSVLKWISEIVESITFIYTGIFLIFFPYSLLLMSKKENILSIHHFSFVSADEKKHGYMAEYWQWGEMKSRFNVNLMEKQWKAKK